MSPKCYYYSPHRPCGCCSPDARAVTTIRTHREESSLWPSQRAFVCELLSHSHHDDDVTFLCAGWLSRCTRSTTSDGTLSHAPHPPAPSLQVCWRSSLLCWVHTNDFHWHRCAGDDRRDGLCHPRHACGGPVGPCVQQAHVVHLRPHLKAQWSAQHSPPAMRHYREGEVVPSPLIPTERECGKEQVTRVDGVAESARTKCSRRQGCPDTHTRAHTHT
jgi:hypothetical protein